MIIKNYKNITPKLLTILLIFSIISPLYANTYINNSIEIDVSTKNRVYDYKENVDVVINIENKNRYAKLHYKINEIYTGGGFLELNNDNTYKVIEPLEKDKKEITLKDKYANDNEENSIDTHIRFNDNYYNRKGKNPYGYNAYPTDEKEYEDFKKYRVEKASKLKKVQPEKGGILKGIHGFLEKTEASGFLFAFIIVLLIGIVIILVIIIVAKNKQRDDNLFSILITTGASIILILSMILGNINNRVYAADIYENNIKYEKIVTTRCTYDIFSCSFDVKIEYYFESTIPEITDKELDTDNDLLPDYLEVLYLTDLNNSDTDEDGLSDYVEIYESFTNPLKTDSNSNGILDSYEDYDNDGLTNIEEVENNSKCNMKDTDNDNLIDYDEVKGIHVDKNTNKIVKEEDLSRHDESDIITYTLDPSNEDTDGDTLRDDVEIRLGLNPTTQYSDGYTNDSERKIEQNFSKVPNELNEESSIPISIIGEVSGNMDDKVHIRKSKDSFYNNLSSMVGEPMKVETEYNNGDGLKVSYDASKYDGVIERLQICRYEDGILVPVKNTYIDGNNIIGEVYTGDYVLVDSNKVFEDLKIYTGKYRH